MIISKYKAPPEPPLHFDISKGKDVYIPFELRIIKTREQGPIYKSDEVAGSIESSYDPIVLSRKSSAAINKIGLDTLKFTELMLDKFRNNLLVNCFINAQWCVYNKRWGASDSYKYYFSYNEKSFPYYLKFFLCSEEYAESNSGKVLGIVSFHEQRR